jgi:flagellar biosynthesis/type III secretory pathway protein FliH
LKSRETRDRPEERRFWKVRLVKSLFDRGLTAEEIRQLFRVIDWLLELPRELERQFQEEIHRFEEERHMPYVTGIERMAREEGLELGREQGHREALQQGIEVALELKFGEAGLELLPLVQAEQRVDVLRAVQRAIRTACTLAEVRELLR